MSNAFEPRTKTEEALHGKALRYLDAMTASREERLSAVDAAVPGVLSCVVLIGAFVIIVFLWMIHMDLAPRARLSGITAFFPGIMTFLISAMDLPLQNAVGSSAAPFQPVYGVAIKWDGQS